MADMICRALRDGSAEGELAPALSIEDSIASPFGPEAFAHVLSQLSSSILAGKSQSRGVVLVALSRSPLFYLDLLKRKGIDVASPNKWIYVLDCYTDPLGWKDQLLAASHEASTSTTVFKDARNTDKLLSSVIEVGRGLVGPGEGRFSVAIDSVNAMLRHASLTSVARLLSNLRSHEQVSSIFWLLNPDLHEARVTSALEYMSSMTATLEPLCQTPNGQTGELESFSLLQRNFGKGRFRVRFKRRNGRVRLMCDEFQVGQSGISFSSVSLEDAVINQSLLPKVQFNIQLSEKERIDREKVVLPFEHQGNGKPIQIYDGRRSIMENKNEMTLDSSGKLQTGDVYGKGGEIIYFRDSDDEMPDSDEDPDDDLDI